MWVVQRGRDVRGYDIMNVGARPYCESVNVDPGGVSLAEVRRGGVRRSERF